MSYGYGGYPPQGGPPPPGGAGGYNQGYGAYPPQQGAYPPQSGSYPPQSGSYPPQPGAYPPGPAQPGMYPPSSGPPAASPYPGGTAYPPTSAPAPGYPPAQTGAPGYPPVGGGPPGAGYPPSSGGLGFERVAPGAPQPPAQNYGAPPGQGGGYYPPQGGYQQPNVGYPPTAMSQPQQYGAPPSAPVYQPPGYGAPGQYPPSQYYPPASHQASTKHLTAGMAAMSIKTHGTVKAHSPFNAEEDAKVLRKAMKGLGTDEKAIINVIAYRSNKQRQDIILAYKQAFGKDLIKDLKSELGGNLESLVKALMMKPTLYDVYCLDKAMSGIGTNEAALIEILSSRSNAQIREIKELYKKEKKRDLEKELRSETSGHFSRLLVSLANAGRDESTNIDATKAQSDATALYQAGEKKWGTDESAFNMVMCSRSHAQLRATFDAYHKIANRDLAKSIESEFSGDIEDGLKAIVEIARNAPAYFASRLHKSMAGGGTNDHALIRVVVSRSEVDLVEIKQEYQKKYGKTLAGSIKGDTSGDYRSLLLAIVGA